MSTASQSPTVPAAAKGPGASLPVLGAIECPHGVRCSGCQYLGVAYEDQLARKRDRLQRALAAHPDTRGLAPEKPRGAKGLLGYRTRAKWMVGPAGELGLFARGGGERDGAADREGGEEGGATVSHLVVDIPSCRVLPAALLRTADAIRTLLAEPAHRDAPFVRAVDARHAVQGTNEQVLVTLVVARPGPPRDVLVKFAESLRALAPVVVGVAVSTTREGAIQVLGDAPLRLAGAAFADDDVGVKVRATFGAFVQASREQSRVLIDLVRAALPRDMAEPRVLDVYGGSGAFALALAERGADVELIESFAPAAALAESTAHARGLSVRAHAGDAAALLEDAATERFDLVVVNPPRRGLSVAARDAIGRTELEKLVYVSCEPRSLARDLAHLSRLGLAVRSLVPVDMMPHTEEIESVVTLVRAPPPAPRVLYEDDELVAIDKDPYEPLQTTGDQARSLLGRVRALPGCEAAQPVHRLDRGTTGVCLFAKRAELVHPLVRALADGSAEKTYLALARGVTHAKGSLSRPLVEAGRREHVTTRYKRREIVGGHSLIEASPHEGKKHQIRRHLASVGHPIVGDERHGDERTARYFSEKHGLDRAFLHCHRITLLHPRTAVPLRVVSPLPDDLGALLETLRQARPKPAPNAAPRR